MIKHIVSFKLKTEYKNKAQLIKQELESLPSKINQIRFFEIGINISDSISAFDMVLVSDFYSLQDLDIYRNHPDHIKVLDLIKLYKKESMVVDYEIK